MKKTFVLVIDFDTWVLTIESDLEVNVEDYDVYGLVEKYAKQYYTNHIPRYRNISRAEYIINEISHDYNYGSDGKYYASVAHPDGVLHF